jgi:hypothetical protein
MRATLLAVAFWAAVGSATARAGIDYRYVADSTNFFGTPGSMVTISLFLQETVTSPSTSLIFSDGGLFGAGINISRDSGNAEIFGNAGDRKITPNLAPSPAGFGGSVAKVSYLTTTATQSQIVVNDGITSPPTFPSGEPGIRRILIGTLNLTVSTSDSVFHVSSLGRSHDTVTLQGRDLDNGSQPADGYTGASTPLLGNFTLAVTVVPEPSSVVLCGTIVIGFGLARFRRPAPARA